MGSLLAETALMYQWHGRGYNGKGKGKGKKGGTKGKGKSAWPREVRRATSGPLIGVYQGDWILTRAVRTRLGSNGGG